jgi:hypothetical protein
VSEADFIGRYLCKYSYGIELLVLKAHGRYSQVVDIDATNGTVVHEGEWRYDIESREVELVDALVVDDFLAN